MWIVFLQLLPLFRPSSYTFSCHVMRWPACLQVPGRALRPGQQLHQVQGQADVVAVRAVVLVQQQQQRAFHAGEGVRDARDVWMCISACLCVSMCVSMCLSVCVCLCVLLCVCAPVCVSLCLCVSVTPVCLCDCLIV